ncbi:MAG TPA: type I restriction enzyme HsdR N-terminal domain-containing protein [Jatrophihabitans sp.]|nr:type I restriction enzyme HsdR N-terminal domain-containing protein [Jatrophihabitans sp.]
MSKASKSGASAFEKLVSDYGDDARTRLSANKNEAQLTLPVSGLVEGAAKLISLQATADREISELDGTVRPDFAVRVDKLMVGHVELKAPGTSLDPTTYAPNSHNGKQWQKLKELPNLLHTNGQEFRLWRYGELVEDPVHVHASNLATFKGLLTASPRLAVVTREVVDGAPG